MEEYLINQTKPSVQKPDPVKSIIEILDSWKEEDKVGIIKEVISCCSNEFSVKIKVTEDKLQYLIRCNDILTNMPK